MVHFVGAGPGAVDLITVRGSELLKKADVIIYAGSLVNPDLLSYARAEAVVHNSAYMTLEEVVEVYRAAEEKGLEVVRLHTGDPSIYGAVREQMDELDRLGIAYDSCPGVTAAFGAAATLNLEYTLPGISQSLVITRMEGKTEVPAKESIENFAATNASMAIYLSSAMLDRLAERLIEGGYAPSTPVALVYKATWPEEQKYITTLDELAELAKEHGIRKTALVIVGDAVRNTSYVKSRLYSSDFSTEYRNAK